MTEATPEMALRIEADVRLRAGQITETQARGIVRAGKVDPLAAMVAQQSMQAHGMAAALRELHSVVKLMEHADETKRPTDSDVDAALLQAERAKAQRAAEQKAAEAQQQACLEQRSSLQKLVDMASLGTSCTSAK